MVQLPFENRYFDDAETLDAEAIRELQTRRCRAMLDRLAEVPLYRERFKAIGFEPGDFRSLADLAKLPFTTKADLREHYPLGMLACPREQIRRIHGSSGTTGKPTFVAYTPEDVQTWAGLCARFLVAGGLRPGHLVQIAFGYGLFTGGFGLHYGVEAVGAAVVPAAAGNTPRQLMLMQDLRPDALVCTPSYALNLAEAAATAGIDPKDLSIRYGYFGGEPWTEDMRLAIEKGLAIHAFNNYGLSEVIGPGVSGECGARTGMHIQEDHFIVECVDPDTLEPVPDGSRGELVFTAMTKQAMPILRYRTRDIATLERGTCPCGRTTVRMGRVVGRSDDMLIIRGANIFPSMIEEALLRIDGATPHYLIEVDRPGALDEVTVKVEVSAEVFSDSMKQMQVLRERISRALSTAAGIRIDVELVGPQHMERFVGKAVRVIDRRKM